jgi:hypothetical protein
VSDNPVSPERLAIELTLVKAAVTAILKASSKKTKSEFARAMSATLEVEEANRGDPNAELSVQLAAEWLERIMPEFAAKVQQDLAKRAEGPPHKG